jgi:hypothetical protein
VGPVFAQVAPSKSDNNRICVQFARSADGGYRQFAIKFFLKREDYLREEGLYRDAAIRRTLPDLVQANDNAKIKILSRSGFPFPPFLVMERGTSLRECAPSSAHRCSSACGIIVCLERSRCIHMARRTGAWHSAQLAEHASAPD